MSIGSKINNSINNINKNDFKELLSNNLKSYYFLPIDNDELIKVTKDIKSKRSLDINNHDLNKRYYSIYFRTIKKDI